MNTTSARFAAAPRAPNARAARVRLPREVVLVTQDPVLERAFVEAAIEARVLVTTTPAALADLLMAGRVGALVLDVGALEGAALPLARHLAEQFPDVPLVGVGTREDEARVAALISSGLIYRFLHRPVSAARVRTFVEAALRRGAEVDYTPPPPPPVRATRHWPLIATAVAATLAVTLGLALHARAPQAPSPVAIERPVAVAGRAPLVSAVPAAREPEIAPPASRVAREPEPAATAEPAPAVATAVVPAPVADPVPVAPPTAAAEHEAPPDAPTASGPEPLHEPPAAAVQDGAPDAAREAPASPAAESVADAPVATAPPPER